MKKSVRICQDCGREFFGTCNARYCPECKVKKRLPVEIGCEMKCKMCGTVIIRNSGNQKYCETCAKKRVLDRSKSPKKNYTTKLFEQVSEENPLSIDIKEIFQKNFSENMKSVVADKSTAKEISDITGKSEKTVYGWSYGISVPPMQILIKLYYKFGEQMLPYITHEGVIKRKEPIPPINDKPISKMCAKSGYTIPQAAKALNKSVVNFRLVYGKDNFGDNAALELLYVFGIDDVLEFFG